MSLSRIRSIRFAAREAGASPDLGTAEVQVDLEDGKFSSFVVATPEQPGRWLEGQAWSFCHGTPVLFVASLDADAVRRAVAAMAAEMGGYWLRYFNSLGDLSKGPPNGEKTGRRRGAP